MLEQIRSWGQHWRQKRVAALLLNRISWTRNWKVWSSDARDDLQWGFIKWWAKANNFLCPLLQKKIQVNELVSIFDFLPFPKLIRWSPQIWNLSCIDMILCRETNWKFQFGTEEIPVDPVQIIPDACLGGSLGNSGQDCCCFQGCLCRPHQAHIYIMNFGTLDKAWPQSMFAFQVQPKWCRLLSQVQSVPPAPPNKVCSNPYASMFTCEVVVNLLEYIL